ncbi:MAG TPA: hypothetical protein VGV59_10130 [Pyrinomonadaceae bacterium]|nr:hypothetical protein [Pyrinomonadaceae bacterium]
MTSYLFVEEVKRLGSGVGRNAFQSRRYVINSYTSLRYAVPADSVRKRTHGLLVRATPEAARRIYDNLRLVLTG